jgi:plasmid stability protein
MYRTCYNVLHMPKMIQIRNVPDDLHKRLKVRAAQTGLSLSDYLKQELVRVAETPTLEELLDRTSRRPPLDLGERIEDAVRAEREGR